MFWQKLGQAVGKLLSPPWKPTAAVLSGFVIWYLQPVFESEAGELRRALIDPSSEPDSWLRSLAILAHRAIFTELIVVCEILVVGTAIVVLTNFAFYCWNRVRTQMRKGRRQVAQRKARATGTTVNPTRVRIRPQQPPTNISAPKLPSRPQSQHPQVPMKSLPPLVVPGVPRTPRTRTSEDCDPDDPAA